MIREYRNETEIIYRAACSVIRASKRPTPNRTMWIDLTVIIKRDYPALYQSAQRSLGSK